MRIYKLIKNEEGAVLPFVALLLAFVLIGFSALIIDLGAVYAERRSLVTAADAAALGGAMILEDALSDPLVEPVQAEGEAIKVAKDLGQANGVINRDDVVVQILWNDTEYNRDVIVVTVKNSCELMFAKIFGMDTTDVSARAVATWGYITKLEGGDILPVFTKDDDYQTDTITYLHSDKFVGTTPESLGEEVVINGNWGLIDIFGSTSGIADAFRGETIGQRMELDYSISNQTGLNSGNVTNPIEVRMQTAASLSEKDDRIRYMSGLVPVIDWENITIQGSSLSLPIEYFAVFEIYDIIVSGAQNDNQKSVGSKYALYDTTDYTCDDIAKEYDKVEGANLNKTSIIGKYTNERVEVRAILQDGDQENPNPGVISATYSKLIE